MGKERRQGRTRRKRDREKERREEKWEIVRL